MKITTLSLLFPLMLSQASEAQSWMDRLTGGAPTITVTLEHPPILSLSVERIAFGPATGECADEFVDALVADFVNNGVEVIDRNHVQAILDEHKFSSSGVVDRKSAAELGKILGPVALVFANVRRCASETQRLTNHRPNRVTGETIYSYISKTSGYFKASVQIIDLATARIHTARTIDETFSLQNESSSGPPEFHSKYTLTDIVISKGVHRVHQMFFPWKETKTLKFYDSKDCNLKLAYNLVQAGNYAAALDQSQSNLVVCQGEKPKVQARAYYNAGMSNFLLANHDAALGYFDQSLRIRPDEVTSQAMAECQKAKEAQMAMEKYEAQADSQSTAMGGSTGIAPVSLSTTPSSTPAAKGGTTVEERLEKLKSLFDKGLITEEEYNAKRAEILKDL